MQVEKRSHRLLTIGAWTLVACSCHAVDEHVWNAIDVPAPFRAGVSTLLFRDFHVGHVQKTSDTIVLNAARRMYSGRPTVVEDWVIHGSSSREIDRFTNIGDVAFSDAGGVLIAEQSTPGVWEFDASGRLLRSFGKRGRGPGEFLSPTGVGVLRDRRVLVHDPRTFRVNVYDSVGMSIATWPAPLRSLNRIPRSLLIDPVGRLLIRDRATDPVSYMRLSAAGGVVDTLVAPNLNLPVPQLTATAPGTSNVRRLVLPFAPSPVAVVSPHGYFVTGMPNRYSFELLRPRSGTAIWREGDPIVSVRRPTVSHAEVQSQEASDYRQSVTSFMRAVEPSWTWRGGAIPNRKPAYRQILVGDDGRILVSLHTTAELNRAVRISRTSNLLEANSRWPERNIVDVFDDDGSYIGQVEFAKGIQPYRTRGDTVLAITVGPEGFQSVRRLRVVWK